jgi:MinD-like ATPase involved in chromosome partitioning or flagellar assembly
VLFLVGPDQLDEVKAPGIAQRVRAGLRTPERIPDIERIADADYVRMLDDAIAAGRLEASSVVAVVSAHAGAGSTTVTLLLATLLSTLRTEQVAVVDACPQSGALSHWIAPESGLSRNTYLALFAPPPAPERVRAAMVRIGRGLAILPAPLDHRSPPAADLPAWGRLIQHLRHLNNMVILDCGSGFQHTVSRAALDNADQVVLVSKPTLEELALLGPTVESIRGQGRTVAVVANQVARQTRAVRSAQGVQQITLAHQPAAAQRLKTRGFSWDDAPASWQESVRELAAVLIGGGSEWRA